MASKRRPLHPTTGASTSSSASSGGGGGASTSYASSGGHSNNSPHATTGSSHLNFRPGYAETTQRSEARGTRPTTAPTTVKEVIIMMIMHLCKKILFYDINIKVALYLGSLFLISLIGDFLPYPKTYFARSDNLFNVYFVKLGWAWTLLLSSPFSFMTSYTLCCGDIQRVIRHHLPRIGIATAFWFSWTKLFNIIENSYGRCTVRGFDGKSSCLKAGHFWNGFDISGHAFILIYSSLILIEEARPIIGWENIKEHLRNEEHNRQTGEKTNSNPLRYLKDFEIKKLRELHDRFTPTIRTLFIGCAALQLLWDVMLVCTMLYYHKMIEKVLSGIIAILTWFFTYRVWYQARSTLPNPAGHGMFNYQQQSRGGIGGGGGCNPIKRSPSLVGGSQSSSGGSGIGGGMNSNRGGGSNSSVGPGEMPKFMGMPLYANLQQRAAASGGGESNTNEHTSRFSAATFERNRFPEFYNNNNN